MSEKILEIKDERLSFFTPAGEVKALNGVSFSMNQGDVLGIVGESGSGKSVTAYSIMGLTAYPGRLVGGTVWFNGHQIDKMTEKEFRKIRGNEVSIIFQDPMTSLNPVYTIGNQIVEVIRLHTQKSKQEAWARARELLELVGLPDKADAYPAQLSGGQKQRIAIARALATDPKVLLCDEATSALDPNTTHAILQLIQKINRELGITVVIITHQMSVVEEVCNRVAILDNGTVVEEGEVQAIFSHPTSKAARRLVYPAGAPQAEPLPGHKLVRVAFGGTQTTDKPLVASLAIECGALVSIMAADTRIVNGQTLGTMLLALPDDDKAAAALDYIKNYPGITYEEVNG